MTSVAVRQPPSNTPLIDMALSIVQTGQGSIDPTMNYGPTMNYPVTGPARNIQSADSQPNVQPAEGQQGGGRPTGHVSPGWLDFFSSLVALPPPIAVLTPGASPWSYTASQGGFLLIKGGTISSIQITRGRVTITTGLTSGFIPLGRSDVAIVTYTVVPTNAWFLPFK